MSHFTRRRFLQAGAASALAAPYIIPSSALGRGRTAPSNRITMALVGCGGMGTGDMRGFLNFDEVQVVAVCDPDRIRAEAAAKIVTDHYASQTGTGQFKGCVAVQDFRKVMERADIDTIIQATPDHWHGIIVTSAARSGKDIYGEKPLSLTVREGRAMSDTVTRFGRVFQTGSQQRSDPRFRKAIELVRNGRLGRIHHVTCGLPTGSKTQNFPTIPVPDTFDFNRWLGPAPVAPYSEHRTHWDFRWILDYSGGQLTDWGAHHIDIAHLGLGMENSGPIKIEGSGEYPDDGLYTAAVNYDFNATYSNGVVVRVTNHFENGVKWEGEHGWVFVSRGRIDASDPRLLTERIRPNEWQMTEQNGHQAHRHEFIDAVKTRRSTIAPIEQAHRTITVAHLGNIAMQLGRVIRWNPRTESIAGDATATRMLGRPMRNPWSI